MAVRGWSRVLWISSKPICMGRRVKGRVLRGVSGDNFPASLKVSAAPQQSEICVKFSVFHTVFDVKFWWNFPSRTQTLENVARKISPKFHAKFHDTFGREKRRKMSLPHFCRVAALTKSDLLLPQESVITRLIEIAFTRSLLLCSLCRIAKMSLLYKKSGPEWASSYSKPARAPSFHSQSKGSTIDPLLPFPSVANFCQRCPPYC